MKKFVFVFHSDRIGAMPHRIDAVKVAGLTAIGTTLAINPWFAFDPINLPKMLVLSTGAGFLGTLILFRLKELRNINKLFLSLAGLFTFSLTLSLLINEAPLIQQFFGTWGRSTGLLTYFSFLFLSLYLATFATAVDSNLIRHYFEKLGYFISSYTLVQWADLDPVNWSQKLMVATLGNINFMSSFLGLVTCSYLVRLFLEGLPVSSKLFFAFMSLLNLSLILVSGSIQGLAIILSGGFLILSIVILRKFGGLWSILASTSTILIGLVALLGSAGLGPLSFIRQETVLFRIDYWKAGWQMTISNPIFGIGVDSYGDFYRQYRDSTAVERTGPQRVTNTAHNIFLDISSGSGILAGFCLLLMVLLVIFLTVKGIVLKTASNDAIAWLAITIGFLVFCLISINQIGVGVWGFVAIGFLLSFERSNRGGLAKAPKSTLKKMSSAMLQKSNSLIVSDKESDHGKSSIKVFISLAVSGLTFALAFLPNLTDSKLLSAVKANDFQKIKGIAQSSNAMDFHREIAIRELSEAGRSKDALVLAREGAQLNPRYWTYWVTIVFSPDSSVAEKKLAISELFELDPNNEEVKSELGNRIAEWDSTN